MFSQIQSKYIISQFTCVACQQWAAFPGESGETGTVRLGSEIQSKLFNVRMHCFPHLLGTQKMVIQPLCYQSFQESMSFVIMIFIANLTVCILLAGTQKLYCRIYKNIMFACDIHFHDNKLYHPCRRLKDIWT